MCNRCFCDVGFLCVDTEILGCDLMRENGTSGIAFYAFADR